MQVVQGRLCSVCFDSQDLPGSAVPAVSVLRTRSDSVLRTCERYAQVT